MAKKKKLDPEQPAEPPPAAPTLTLNDLMEALAKVTAKLQGAEGDGVRQQAGEVRQQVTALIDKLEQRGEPDEATRKAAAAELERLVEAVAKTGTAAGKALEQQREPLKQAFSGVPMSSVAEGLHRFADWLANPTPDKEAEVKRVVEQLQQTLGPLVGFDPVAAQEREDAKQRAEIRADVQKSLDSIFRPKKPE
jgi:hypothetical protein